MKNSKLFLLIIIIFSTILNISAQVAVNTDGSNPDASAILDVKSSDKGILIPRITHAEIKSISNPANGLMVFNTDAGRLYVFIASEFKWKEVQLGSAEILYQASLTIGTGNSCSNTVVYGDYKTKVDLSNADSIVINANVTSKGNWEINTDTVNGYSFSGNGIVNTIGNAELVLHGTGKPVNKGTDLFTATVTLGGNSSCTFNVDVECYIDCNDYNGCTKDSLDKVNCTCIHEQINCDDNNPCTTDNCDPATGCQHVAVDCDDGDPCTTDYCDPATGCQHVAKDCDDGDACTEDSCDPNTGNCIHTPINCDDGDPDTIDSCDPNVGCVHTQSGKGNKKHKRKQKHIK
jgi:hypothetical protein